MLLALFSAVALASTSPASNQAAIEKALSHVPGGAQLSCLFKDYQRIVGSDNDAGLTATLNSGIGSYLQASFTKRGPAAMDHAKDFYADVLAQASQNPGYPSAAQDGESPDLSERAGDTHHQGLPAGWLWKSALSHAEGDPNEAVRLIALCGNDDVGQVGLHYPRPPEEAAHILEERHAWIKSVLAQPHGDGTCEPSWVKRIPDEDSDFQWRKGEIAKRLDCVGTEKAVEAEKALMAYDHEISSNHDITYKSLLCPSGFGLTTSAFFLPGSLGETADVPEALKQKVASAQAPFTCRDNRGAKDPKSCLPAKNYHVYGAAFVTCEMIARGHNPRLVAKLQRALAWYYRAYTLQSLAERCGYGQRATPKSVKAWLGRLEELKRFGERTACSASELADVFPASNISCDSATQDALQLMQHWSVIGEPSGALAGILPRIENAEGKEPPASWSPARFQIARAKVKQFESDFEWTMAAQAAGAQFAAKNCKAETKAKGEPCGL